jgi:hypothetical protein
MMTRRFFTGRIITDSAKTVIRTTIPGYKFTDGKERHLDTEVFYQADSYNHGRAWTNTKQLYDGIAGKAYEAYRAEIERILSINSENIISGLKIEIIEG